MSAELIDGLDPAYGGTLERLQNLIARRMNPPGDRDQIHADATLRDLGFDSLSKIEVVIEVEEDFGIVIDDDTLDEIETVGDLVKAVDREMKEG
jgi:acyl carrier protein